MSLQYEAPPAGLEDFISVFYQFECSGPRIDIERAQIGQLRFMLSGSGEYEFDGGVRCTTSPAHIIGPTSCPMQSSTAGPVRIFGVGLRPAGWAGIMGSHASDYAERAIDAVELLGTDILDVLRHLRDAPDTIDRAAILSATIRKLLGDVGEAPVKFVHTVDGWLASSIDPQIDDLIDRTGLSARQLERMTRRFYGVPPKQLARKYRALRAASAISQGVDLNSAQFDGAFYDQSHLIREIKHFTGMTPGEIKNQGSGSLTEATIRGRRALSSQVSRLVSDT